jgi:hypothetical protein
MKRKLSSLKELKIGDTIYLRKTHYRENIYRQTFNIDNVIVNRIDPSYRNWNEDQDGFFVFTNASSNTPIFYDCGCDDFPIWLVITR